MYTRGSLYLVMLNRILHVLAIHKYQRKAYISAPGSRRLAFKSILLIGDLDFFFAKLFCCQRGSVCAYVCVWVQTVNVSRWGILNRFGTCPRLIYFSSEVPVFYRTTACFCCLFWWPRSSCREDQAHPSGHKSLMLHVKWMPARGMDAVPC